MFTPEFQLICSGSRFSNECTKNLKLLKDFVYPSDPFPNFCSFAQ